MNRISTLTAFAGLAMTIAAGAAAQNGTVIYGEDFESVVLGPNVNEGIDFNTGLGMIAQAWSPTLPAGWTEAPFSTPGAGVVEWESWNVADQDFWTGADDQRRTEFVAASSGFADGSIIVADADEWDDFCNNCPGGGSPDDEGLWAGDATTPAINIAGVAAGSLRVVFASSWRDEDNQTAALEVSYNGGAFTNVFTYSSDPMSVNFNDDAPNDRVEVALNNPPGATTVRLRWRLFDAINNWWYAVDNITLVGNSAAPDADRPAIFAIGANVYNQTATPAITFDEVDGADSYTVQLAQDEGFSDIAFTQQITQAAGYSLPPGAAPNGIYFVRVLANNTAGSRVSANAIQIVIDNPDLGDYDGSGVRDTYDYLHYLDDVAEAGF
jgi:hypothetical protein